jgi:glyoxylase-like metal-dependent hydrolase (beta-lactamase superfamily II)
LTTGRVRGPRRPRGARRYLIRSWSDETLPVNAFLIEHPAGFCLVDTGQDAAAAEPGFLPRWHPFIRIARFELGADDMAAPQLRKLGVEPVSVRWVVLTHLHTDHLGGVGDFSGSDIVVSNAEWSRAQGLRGRLIGYVPRQWPPGVVPRLVDLDGPALGPFAASLDLVGDGSIVLVPLPGHTPGQLGVLVRGAGGTALLGGDVAHDPGELEVNEPALADYCRQEGIAFLAAHDDDVPLILQLGGDATAANP